MTKQAEHLLEGAAQALIAEQGLFGLHATDGSPRYYGEPLTITNGERSYSVEVRVQDITGWERER